VAAPAESFGSTAIRVDGGFNPVIVNTDWLVAKGLIDESDRDYAMEPEQGRVLVTSLFSGGLYPWVEIEVSREALNVTSTDETETPERLRDLVIRLLKALPETPAHGVGVSHYWHVKTGQDRWQRIAETVAPSTPWTDLVGETQLDSLERRIELQGGQRTVAVEPSRRPGYELYFDVRRQWDVATPPGVDPAVAMEALDRGWQEALDTAKQLLEATLDIG
jgi:hypothetical protein